MILAMDMETSGLPVAGIPKGSEEYPWMVQVGCVLFDDDGKDHGLLETYVRSGGRKIQPGATAVHGITDRHAGREGLSEIATLAVLCGFAAQAMKLVGFSVAFDRDIAESALIRNKKETRMLLRPGLELVDLRVAATHLCKIESGFENGQYRWPSLDAACEVILGEPPRPGPHRGLEDAMRCKRLYLELVKRDMIEVAA